jgi:HK97 family phage major capsid protein
LEIGKLASDPTAYWRRETASVTASAPSFGKITLRPKVLATLVPISIEWLEDVSNGQQLITTAIQNAMALELDRAALKGTGGGAEPLGIVNASGVNAQTAVGTPTTYSNITTSVKNILVDNFNGPIEALSWVMNPIQAATYQGLVTGISSDNTPLTPPEWAAKLQRFYTNSLAINTGNSPQDYDMVVGDFSQMVWGLRSSGMTIEVLSSGQATDADSNSFNALTEMYRYVRVYIRMDVGLLHSNWFDVLSGVTA